METNEDKCKVLLLTNKNVLVNVCTAQIQNSSFKKSLGIKIDFKLDFKDHTGSICKKASVKLNPLTKVLDYHCVKRARIRSYSGPNAGKYRPE